MTRYTEFSLPGMRLEARMTVSPAASGWLQRWRALPLLASYCLFIIFTLAG